MGIHPQPSKSMGGYYNRMEKIKDLLIKLKKIDGIRRPGESLQDEKLKWLATGDRKAAPGGKAVTKPGRAAYC